MKGLLLKDFYFTRSAYLIGTIVTILFAIALFLDVNSYFFLFLPIILSSIVSIASYNADEKYKTTLLAEIFPCSRKTVVSSKYILSIIYSGITLLILLLVEIVIILRNGIDVSTNILSLISLVLFLAVLPPSLAYPLAFKFNATKAQNIVYFSLGAILGITSFSMGFIDGMSDGRSYCIPPLGSIIIIFASIIIFALSWFISIRIYNKRDLA